MRYCTYPVKVASDSNTRKKSDKGALMLRGSVINLLSSSGYISNVVDMICDRFDVGLAIWSDKLRSKVDLPVKRA